MTEAVRALTLPAGDATDTTPTRPVRPRGGWRFGRGATPGRQRRLRQPGVQLGRGVIRLQFHLETTPASARELVAHCGDELVSAPYVQSAETPLAVPEASYAALNALLGELLAYLLEGMPGH